MNHQCKALVVTCLDFRFQQTTFDFLAEQGLIGQYDLFSVAGAQKTFLAEKSQAIALEQVELSVKLHGISVVYLIAHWDCGAYGGSQAFVSDDIQKKQYLDDLSATTKVIKAQNPELEVKKFLAIFNDNQIEIKPV